MRRANFIKVLRHTTPEVVADQLFKEAHRDYMDHLYSDNYDEYIISLFSAYREQNIKYVRKLVREGQSNKMLVTIAIVNLVPIEGCPLYNALIECIHLNKIDKIL